MKTKEIIYFASTKKKAKDLAQKEYGDTIEYVKPYKYSKGKGNNFYEFKLKI